MAMRMVKRSLMLRLKESRRATLMSAVEDENRKVYSCFMVEEENRKVYSWFMVEENRRVN
jgi:hypothetical protein